MAKGGFKGPAPEPVEHWRRAIAKAVAPHGNLVRIAKGAGMTSPQLQKIANGATPNPGIVTIARIAEAMGMTLDELVIAPSPERTAAGEGQGHPLLDQFVTELAPNAEAKDWKADVVAAIAALTRALQRAEPNSRTPEEPPGETGRRAASNH